MAGKRIVLQKNVPINGKISRFANNCPKDDGWFSGRVRLKNGSEVSVKGVITEKKPYIGMEIQAVGDLVQSNYGDQYDLFSILVSFSSDKQIVKYLSSELFDGIGKVTAEKIAERYHNDFMDAILSDPDKVKEDCKLSAKQIDSLVTGLTAKDSVHMICRNFPHIPMAYVKKIVKDRYIGHTYPIVERRIKEDPYVLMEIPGLTFRIADQVALEDVGLDWADVRRVLKTFLLSVEDLMNSSGATYFDIGSDEDTTHIANKMRDLLDPLKQRPWFYVDGHFIQTAYSLAVTRGHCVLEEYLGGSHLYLNEMYIVERHILSELSYKVHETFKKQPVLKQDASAGMAYLKRNPQVIGYVPNKEQFAAVESALSHTLSCITGGPGRGKTTVVKALCEAWRHVHSDHVLMLAPTGKAVCRMKEQTGHDNCETIARCVCMNQKHIESELQYKCNDDVKIKDSSGTANHPLNGDTLIVIDEASMIDFEEAAAILQMFHYCHIVFVGDADQLRPVEPGSFFKEMVKSGMVPCARLVVNNRTKSTEISENADRIIDGNPSLIPAQSFMQLPVAGNGVIQSAVAEYKSHLAAGAEFSDVMLLSPFRRHDGGVTNMNRVLQDELNPLKPSVQQYDMVRSLKYLDGRGMAVPKFGDCFDGLRVGDRLVNTKNRADHSYHVYKDNNPDAKLEGIGHGIYNGDAGTLLRYYFGAGMDSPQLCILLDDGRMVFVDALDGKDWTLGYCTTVHKSQGSEAEHVILLLPDECTGWFVWNHGFISRNLLYTAVTRAKTSVRVYGMPKIMQHGIETPLVDRNVVLSSKLIDVLAKDVAMHGGF